MYSFHYGAFLAYSIEGTISILTPLWGHYCTYSYERTTHVLKNLFWTILVPNPLRESFMDYPDYHSTKEAIFVLTH